MTSKRTTGSAGRRERREFSAAFKAEAVRVVAERRAAGVTLAQVRRELDVRPDQLCEWVSQQGREGGVTTGVMPGESLEQENRRLRREVALRPGKKHPCFEYSQTCSI